MYVTIRRYTGAGARAEEIARRVERGLVPMLKGQPGFKGYCAFASENGDAVSVSIFEERGQAVAANDRAKGWVQSDLRDLLPDPPEVFAGTCRVVEVAREREQHAGSGRSLHVAIREYDRVGSVTETERFVRENTLPLLVGAPGFRGCYILRDDPGETRAAAITLFDSRDHSMEAQESILRVIREKGGDIVPPPSRIITGQTLVLAMG